MAETDTRGVYKMTRTSEKYFLALLSAFAFVITSIFGYVVFQVNTISTAVVEINVKIGVILSEAKNRDKSIVDHEDRLREMERQK